jgi:hypothetical protein
MNTKRGLAPIIILFIVLGVAVVGSSIYYYGDITEKSSPRNEDIAVDEDPIDGEGSQDEKEPADDSHNVTFTIDKGEVTPTNLPQQKDTHTVGGSYGTHALY